MYSCAWCYLVKVELGGSYACWCGARVEVGLEDTVVSQSHSIFSCIDPRGKEVSMEAWPRDEVLGQHEDGFGLFRASEQSVVGW